MRRLFTWSGLAVAFAVFMIWKRPHESANAVSNVGGILLDIGNGFATFFTSLVS